MTGQRVLLRARLQTTRAKGKQCFMVLRQKSSTVQAVLAVDKEQKVVSKQMVKFCGSLRPESIVLVEAIVVKAFVEVKTCTVSLVELQVEKVSYYHHYDFTQLSLILRSLWKVK
jgi:aspartyl-tRNA synthetase